MCVCVCVSVCERACVRACVCVSSDRPKNIYEFRTLNVQQEYVDKHSISMQMLTLHPGSVHAKVGQADPETPLCGK